MRAIRLLAVGAALGFLAPAALVAPVSAQTSELQVTTPYPAVVVAAGGSVTFDLEVTAPGRERVDLAVTRVPSGWEALLRGGGFLIDGVYTDPEEPPELELEVSVPEDAPPGTYRIVVAGTSVVGSDVLELDIRVARLEAGQVTLTTEFPQLQGPADATYQFDLALSNDTPRDTVFELEGAGPPGWQVTVKPAGQERASSVEVGAGQTERLSVEVDPSDQAVAGTYPVQVAASGGGQVAGTELVVRIVGSYALTVTTPDERLNADVAAGDPTEVPILVVNEGTAPLREVALSASAPRGWKVEFRPGTIEQIAPGDAVRATAIVTAADEAVAGDYLVTISADAPETSDEIDLRTTVRTSRLWGLVGVGLIVAALGGLGAVFRRFGRR